MKNSLGVLAAFLTLVQVAALIPQLVAIVRAKSARNLSIMTFGAATVGFAAWTVWAMVVPVTKPVLLSNLPGAILNAAIVIAIIYFGSGGDPPGRRAGSGATSCPSATPDRSTPALDAGTRVRGARTGELSQLLVIDSLTASGERPGEWLWTAEEDNGAIARWLDDGGR